MNGYVLGKRTIAACERVADVCAACAAGAELIDGALVHGVRAFNYGDVATEGHLILQIFDILKVRAIDTRYS